MKYLIFSLKCIILFALLSIPNTAYAEGASLKIQPSLLQIRAKSPADIKAPFKIVNTSEETISLKILLKRFRDNGEQNGNLTLSNPDAVNEGDKDSFLRQIEILDKDEITQSLTLGPKQEKQLTLSLKLEKNVPQSDQYFSVIFQTEGNDQNIEVDSNSSFSKAKLAVAMPVLLAINTTNRLNGLIDNFSGPIALQAGPVPFTVKIKNPSEHFITVKGAIFITNMFGQTVGRVDIPSTNILANSTRSLTNYLQAFQQPKVLWTERFLLGFYSAKLAVAISPDQILYTRTIYFAAFPFAAITTVIFILVLAFFIIRRIKNKVSEE